jgi:hypothetical protein
MLGWPIICNEAGRRILIASKRNGAYARNIQPSSWRGFCPRETERRKRSCHEIVHEVLASASKEKDNG